MTQTCWTVPDRNTQQLMDYNISSSGREQCSSPSPSHQTPDLNQTAVAILIVGTVAFHNRRVIWIQVPKTTNVLHQHIIPFYSCVQSQ